MRVNFLCTRGFFATEARKTALSEQHSPEHKLRPLGSPYHAAALELAACPTQFSGASTFIHKRIDPYR